MRSCIGDGGVCVELYRGLWCGCGVVQGMVEMIVF